ncbi:MAG: ATP-binding protein [Bdellovibrionota bacterium]
MKPEDNPYAPGAGTPPPELTGRDALLNDADIALKRIKKGLSEQSYILTGLRGVGKTVLLNKILQDARRLGFVVDLIEAPENRKIAELLVPSLRKATALLNVSEGLKVFGTKVLRVIKSFSLTMKVAETDLTLSLDPERGIADSGDIERDLSDLLEEVGILAKEAGKGVALLIDEIQYLSEQDLAALIVAAHRIAQRQLPVMIIGAGLPMLPGISGNAKSYAERLFKFPEIGALQREDAIKALVEPARHLGVEYLPEALDQILKSTKGYPYFLQEWGYATWNYAQNSPITLNDVNAAQKKVIEKLDNSFFRVRLDRMTDSEKRYLRGLAQLGPGPHETKKIASLFNKKNRSFGPARDSLIKKGMIYSPSHGFLEFTVPLFDEFMRRFIPDFF